MTSWESMFFFCTLLLFNIQMIFKWSVLVHRAAEQKASGLRGRGPGGLRRSGPSAQAAGRHQLPDTCCPWLFFFICWTWQEKKLQTAGCLNIRTMMPRGCFRRWRHLHKERQLCNDKWILLLENERLIISRLSLLHWLHNLSDDHVTFSAHKSHRGDLDG